MTRKNYILLPLIKRGKFRLTERLVIGVLLSAAHKGRTGLRTIQVSNEAHLTFLTTRKCLKHLSDLRIVRKSAAGWSLSPTNLSRFVATRRFSRHRSWATGFRFVIIHLRENESAYRGVVRCLREKGVVSPSRIARIAGMSRTTITRELAGMSEES